MYNITAHSIYYVRFLQVSNSMFFLHDDIQDHSRSCEHPATRRRFRLQLGTEDVRWPPLFRFVNRALVYAGRIDLVHAAGACVHHRHLTEHFFRLGLVQIPTFVCVCVCVCVCVQRQRQRQSIKTKTKIKTKVCKRRRSQKQKTETEHDTLTHEKQVVLALQLTPPDCNIHINTHPPPRTRVKKTWGYNTYLGYPNVHPPVPAQTRTLHPATRHRLR